MNTDKIAQQASNLIGEHVTVELVGDESFVEFKFNWLSLNGFPISVFLGLKDAESKEVEALVFGKFKSAVKL